MGAKMTTDDVLRLMLANVVAEPRPGQPGLRVLLENARIAEKDGRPGPIEADRVTVLVDVEGKTLRFDFEPFSPFRSRRPFLMLVEE